MRVDTVVTEDKVDDLRRIRKDSPLLSSYPLTVIKLLWEAWSEQQMAGFLIVNDEYILEFRKWYLLQIQSEGA